MSFLSHLIDQATRFSVVQQQNCLEISWDISQTNNCNYTIGTLLLLTEYVFQYRNFCQIISGSVIAKKSERNIPGFLLCYSVVTRISSKSKSKEDTKLPPHLPSVTTCMTSYQIWIGDAEPQKLVQSLTTTITIVHFCKWMSLFHKIMMLQLTE
jgi:hypothetical protein